eukprot:104261-Alexandrium_andersonii.AAC.1
MRVGCPDPLAPNPLWPLATPDPPLQIRAGMARSVESGGGGEGRANEEKGGGEERCPRRATLPGTEL